MKKISPYIIVLYILGILLLLSPLLYLFPEKGIRIGQTKLHFATLESLTTDNEIQKKDIEQIITKIDTTMKVLNIDSLTKPKNDSLVVKPQADSIKKPVKDTLIGLVMNAKAKQYLHRFFIQLNKARSKRIGILHYGDSQIESDRITSYIRQKMQLQFGGYGPGMIPATDIFNTFSFSQTFSDNFKRYTAIGGKKLKSGRYGAMISASRFTPETDTTGINLDSLPMQTAWIQIAPSKKAYSRSRKFTRVTLHYNECIVPVKLKVVQNQQVIKETDLIQDGKQHSIVLSFKTTPNDLKFEFSGKISPNICAFSLEGNAGLSVSNIALRGSDGTQFRRIKYANMSQMMRETNAQLVLMQFGGNSVVYFKDSTQIRNYANWFKRQIQTVQKAMPGKMVIVIGPSDMSKLTNDNYETYPFLPYTVSEMKRVSLEANAAYWDLYAAMGGKNSMPAWVEKRLAAKDYVHFSSKGAKFAAELFWRAFTSEYIQWKKQIKQ